MDPGQMIFSGVMTLLMYGVIAFVVYKVLTLAKDMSEVKELLKDIQRNTQDHSPDGIAARLRKAQEQSPADLMRAVNNASYSEFESENADLTK